MSIYSGFATRALEAQYNTIVYKIMFILQMKIYRDSTQSKFAYSYYLL